ncbi:MAG: hypothetical protein V4519_05320 [Patescibacteria group bacterium]
MPDKFPGFDEGNDNSIEIATEKIAAATNFDELYEVLRQIEGVQGSTSFYSADKLIKYIDLIRKMAEDNPGGFMYSVIGVTGSCGLREKVNQLAINEYPKLAGAIKKEKVEIKREESLEQHYAQKLQEEYSFDPIGELSANIDDPKVVAKLEALYDKKVSLFNEEDEERKYMDEDLMILSIHADIIVAVIKKGSISFDQVRRMVEVDLAFSHIPPSSLITYSLRKAWDEMKDILANYA